VHLVTFAMQSVAPVVRVSNERQIKVEPIGTGIVYFGAVWYSHTDFVIGK